MPHSLPITRKTAMLTALLCLLAPFCAAQTSTSPSMPTAAEDAVLIDRVVAIVNGDLILESDIDEERRFQAFQPIAEDREFFSRAEAVHRIVDRTLILQQARLQPGEAVSDEAVDAELARLRKEIPACRQFHCETDAGWDKFVAAQGFTPDGFFTRWKERMTVLKFIEVRFRMGIRIAPDEIQTYYDKTLLPEYAKQKVPAPKLDVISDRIQEILLQQQVGNLLDEWLKSLRSQGSVRLIQPDEVTP